MPRKKTIGHVTIAEVTQAYVDSLAEGSDLVGDENKSDGTGKDPGHRIRKATADLLAGLDPEHFLDLLKQQFGIENPIETLLLEMWRIAQGADKDSTRLAAAKELLDHFGRIAATNPSIQRRLRIDLEDGMAGKPDSEVSPFLRSLRIRRREIEGERECAAG